ncbi:helix-turn-helix domain-containing protein [Herbaspirillum sp. RV1423]|uniref:helix-turn-helix domain-containing protein n=1 Tax=Herbaspirillum sp. RV1423 TaxID=1443993 RepID=UPI0004B6340F|nr:helix-turn-helix transcriptional regulator [Herbaspirillum sp. RV1423]
MKTHARQSPVFTTRLKEARRRAELSQYQLGTLAGIDEFTASARMNQYERGVHEPDFGTVVRLADALKVPVSFLFEPDDRLAELILLAGQLDAKELARLIVTLKQT